MNASAAKEHAATALFHIADPLPIPVEHPLREPRGTVARRPTASVAPRQPSSLPSSSRSPWPAAGAVVATGAVVAGAVVGGAVVGGTVVAGAVVAGTEVCGVVVCTGAVVATVAPPPDDDPEAIAGRHHRTTHTYLVDPADLGRFAELGMIADQQQSQNAVETDYHDFLAGFIGDRADDLIPTELLLDAGATVTLSSDWDAGPLPPLGTIERSLTRDANAVPDLETAIRMHTLDAAVALGHDDTTGSIEAGKFADYVVLDADPFEVEPDDLDETEVLMTVVGGDAVYAAPGFPS